jgi:AbrB family looped-hinge helix DNA binding protein
MVITMDERGQIVIPTTARDAPGLRSGVTMELRVQGQTLVIQKCVKLDLSPWIG